MGDTAIFFSFSLVATAAAFCSITWNRSVPNSQIMARGFYVVSIVLSSCALVWVLVDTREKLPQGVELAWYHRVFIYRAWLVIGTAVGAVLVILLNISPIRKWSTASDAMRSFITSPYLLRGLCISVSMSFIATEIGKSGHDAEMRQFFIQSGYSVWFLYFIMVAETLGAVALLVPRTMTLAVIGLSLIMIGAIWTHLHNHDLFSDSLEALHLLVLLACIVLIRQLRGRVRRKNSGAIVDAAVMKKGEARG